MEDQQHFEPSMYTIQGILVLDNNGNKLFSKYYGNLQLSSTYRQVLFEKKLFNKTNKKNDEILMFDGLLCVYKCHIDLIFYVIGSTKENEAILMSVLNCLLESLNRALKRFVEKKIIFENIDVLMLVVDEICDHGVILEMDPDVLVSRIPAHSEESSLNDQIVSQVFRSTKEHFKMSLM